MPIRGLIDIQTYRPKIEFEAYFLKLSSIN